MNKFLPVLFAVVLLGAGCTTNYEDFPIVNEEAPFFEDVYYVCADEETGERIYQVVFCGDDSCWSSFYDIDGLLIERTPELSVMYDNLDEQVTKVENCQRTTENYFMSKVEEK